MTGTPAPRRAMRKRLLETRGHAWLESGVARQLSRRAVKRARIHVLVLAPAVVAILLVYSYRIELFGEDWDGVVRAATAISLVMLGWQLARDVGRSVGPQLFRHLEPATAGTVGFLIRFATMVVAVVLALRIAQLDPQTIALSGAFTAVVLGLAAQQTLGNLIAGTVLVSARPFRVGDRVRMQGGGLAGTVEGVVSSFGLLYTILAQGEDSIMVPNSIVMNVAVVPLREPTGVDLRARLRPGATPEDVQVLLEEAVRTPLKGPPRVTLEELDGDEVVVRIGATPVRSSDGPRLASEVLRVISPITATPRDRSPASGAHPNAGTDRIAMEAPPMTQLMTEQGMVRVPAGTWVVDPAHSSVAFEVRHMMISTVRGQFREFEGRLDAAEDDPANSYIEGAVKVASIETGNADRDAHLRSPEFFDAERHPEIRFSSTRIEHVEGGTYRVTGDLTMKGVTKEVTMDASVEGAGEDPWGAERVGVRVRGSVDRRDFGLTWQQPLTRGGVLVGEEIRIMIDVSAVRAE